MAYDRINNGALFRNKDKTEDKHPDYNGKLNVGGVDYWVAAWVKESKAGQKYMSLSVKPVEAKEAPKQAPKSSVEDMPDDLPF